VLEVSTDGTTYRQLAERVTAFSQMDPWVYLTPAHESARFVRVRGEHEGVLVLTEVEVYAHR